MIFTTYWFLTAAAIFLFAYSVVRNSIARTILLIAFCALFHFHFAGPAGVVPIIIIGICTFSLALTRRKFACTIGIVMCACTLLMYKYSHFLLMNCLGRFHIQAISQLDQYFKATLPSAPPLAISFFVFEFVHYLWDVRSGSEPIRKFHEFIQFAIFFPSLVAGPIKRYQHFLPSLAEGKKSMNWQDSAQGLTQVAAGFFKKIVLADNLTLYIKATEPNFGSIHLPERWFFLLALAFRIYLDFSGYSDIAIGTARMMGIQLPRNFNWPYIARNMQDFWQRWHISLSSWIRDYIYIPLGGSKHGQVRRSINALIAFALCGLWHGAAWNFVLWGLYHGCGLATAALYRTGLGSVGQKLGNLFDRAPAFAWLCTFLYVCFGWLLFFYPAHEAIKMARLLFVAG
jgi:alginate O-acetyltransferase complex protein AlgI